jgi:transcriptional regulator with XRE-family HTH domain
MSTLGSRIRAAREARGLTQDDVARHFGIKRVSVTQWESDTTKPALARIAELAELLGISEQDILKGGKTPAASRPPKPPRPETPKVEMIPGDDLVGARDFPVYAAAMGGEGHLIVNFEQIETVKRPSILEGVRNAYALLISGDSMRPAFNHGDMALVHPGLPVARDKVHIFYDHPPFGEAGEAEAMIKSLVGWTNDKWKLEQYNPAKLFDVDRIDWPTAHRVVGRYDAR